MPETTTCGPRQPDTNPWAFAAGNYACSQDEFEAILIKNGVDMSKVTLIPGFYNDSLTDSLKAKLGIETADIVNVDCDLYESTVNVLNFVTNYLRTGTLLLFDDWLAYVHPFRGEPQACHEWLEANPQICLTEYFKYTETGVAFIVSILSTSDQELARPQGQRPRRAQRHRLGLTCSGSASRLIARGFVRRVAAARGARATPPR